MADVVIIKPVKNSVAESAKLHKYCGARQGDEHHFTCWEPEPHEKVEILLCTSGIGSGRSQSRIKMKRLRCTIITKNANFCR
jgi:hypothetical protein